MKDPKRKIYSGDPPSEFFEDAFRDNCSGCRRVCACGRTCFDNENSYDWDKGELEGLRQQANKDPDHFMALPYSVGTMTIDGSEWVMGCPCNGARRFQDFIDRHQIQIAEYLNSRSKGLRHLADAIAVEETTK